MLSRYFYLGNPNCPEWGWVGLAKTLSFGEGWVRLHQGKFKLQQLSDHRPNIIHHNTVALGRWV